MHRSLRKASAAAKPALQCAAGASCNIRVVDTEEEKSARGGKVTWKTSSPHPTSSHQNTFGCVGLFLAPACRRNAQPFGSNVAHLRNSAVLSRTMATAASSDRMKSPPPPQDKGGHIVQAYLDLVRDQAIQLDPKQLGLAKELQVSNARRRTGKKRRKKSESLPL